MSDRSVRPETLAGDPFAAAPKRPRRSRRTEAELVEAIREDEAQQGRPMTPAERDAFARGFFGQEYADGREEYGRWEPTSENDLYCPVCGIEGE